jgi:hypothetical protein
MGRYFFFDKAPRGLAELFMVIAEDGAHSGVSKE